MLFFLIENFNLKRCAEELAKPCVCGILNTSKTMNLLSELSKEELK